ncbi:MAG: hypothetical protein QXZ30_01160 [Candidatus Bilamarchaeaceae archaeon]
MAFKQKTDQADNNKKNLNMLNNVPNKESINALRVEAEEILKNEFATTALKKHALSILRQNHITESAPHVVKIVFASVIQEDLYRSAFKLLAEWLQEGEGSVADAIINELRVNNSSSSIEIFFDLVDYAPKLFAQEMLNNISDTRLSYFLRTLFIDYIVTTQNEMFMYSFRQKANTHVLKIIEDSESVINGFLIFSNKINQTKNTRDFMSMEDEISGVVSLLVRISSAVELNKETQERISQFAIDLCSKGYDLFALQLIEKINIPSSLMVLDMVKQNLNDKLQKRSYSSLKQKKEWEEILNKVEAEIKKRGVVCDFFNC